VTDRELGADDIRLHGFPVASGSCRCLIELDVGGLRRGFDLYLRVLIAACRAWFAFARLRPARCKETDEDEG